MITIVRVKIHLITTVTQEQLTGANITKQRKVKHMTDLEAMTRFINAFRNVPLDFDNPYWDKLHAGTEWMEKTFPNSVYSEVARQYYESMLLIRLIDHEILVKKGINYDDRSDESS